MSIANEAESKWAPDLLTGVPQVRNQRRGALWEVSYGPEISAADAPGDGGVERIIRAQLRIVDSASINLYDPLRDAPNSFIELAEFGEKIWREGFTWSDALIQETVEFHEKYGPLIPNQSPTEPPKPVSIYQHWQEACRLALALICYKSLRPEETILRDWVIETIISSLIWDLASIPQEHVAGLQHRLQEWISYQGQRDEKTQDEYEKRAGGWLSQTINRGLQEFGVRSQVMFSPPSSWITSYVALSLAGALWGQFASLILAGSTIKQCKYELCRNPKFTTQNARKEYCSELCKENRKKRERRRRSN